MMFVSYSFASTPRLYRRSCSTLCGLAPESFSIRRSNISVHWWIKGELSDEEFITYYMFCLADLFSFPSFLLKLPELMQAKSEYLIDGNLVELELSMSSQLRMTLCEGAGADCRAQPPSNEVVLTTTLGCDSAECDVDAVRVIKVAEGRYWEYVRLPCVELAFFEDGKELGRQFRGSASHQGAICANPKLPVAFEACCGTQAIADLPTCEQCSDKNVCTKDTCTEDGGCLNIAIPGCESGAIMVRELNSSTC